MGIKYLIHQYQMNLENVFLFDEESFFTLDKILVMETPVNEAAQTVVRPQRLTEK